MTRVRRRPRGFTITVIALFLLSLTTAALALSAAGGVADVRRTGSVAVGAQLRQLLTAGAADAVERSRRWGADAPAGSGPVAIPAELAARGYRLAVRVAAGAAGGAEVTVRAEGDGQRMAQRVTLRRVGDRWQVAGAELSAG